MDFRNLRSMLTILCVNFGNAQECEYVLVDLPDNLLIDTNIDIGQSIYNITAVDVYFRNTTGVVTLMSPSENFDVINNKVVVTNCPYLEQEIRLSLLPDNNENCQVDLHIAVTAPVADIVVCSQSEVFVETLESTIDVLEFELVNVRDCGQFVCSVRSDTLTNNFLGDEGVSDKYFIKTSTTNISFGDVYTLKLACVDINVEDIPPEAFVDIDVTFTNSTASRCISNAEPSTSDVLISNTHSMLHTPSVVTLVSSLTMPTSAFLSNVSSTVVQPTSTANPDEKIKLFFDYPGNIAAISAATGVVLLGSAAVGVYALASKRCLKMPTKERVANDTGEANNEEEN